jgi:inosose dehydratase
MSVRLGINPIGWTNDCMRWLGDLVPLETCLAEARAAGFSGIELGRKFPRDAKTLGPILDRHGLALVSGWYSARLLERDARAEIAALGDHLSLLKRLGAKVLVFAETSGEIINAVGAPASSRPRIDDPSAWRAFCRGLSIVADCVQSHGLRLAYHHHMGTAIETAEEIDRLMAETDESVGLLLDTGHLTVAGGDPVAAAARHAGRIVHVHCKDVRRYALESCRRLDASFSEAVLAGIFTAPGDGIVDFAGVLGALKRSGYQGWLVQEAEQDPVRAHPFLYAQLGRAELSRVAARAGFEVAGEEPALRFRAAGEDLR